MITYTLSIAGGLLIGTGTAIDSIFLSIAGGAVLLIAGVVIGKDL